MPPHNHRLVIEALRLTAGRRQASIRLQRHLSYTCMTYLGQERESGAHCWDAQILWSTHEQSAGRKPNTVKEPLFGRNTGTACFIWADDFQHKSDLEGSSTMLASSTPQIYRNIWLSVIQQRCQSRTALAVRIKIWLGHRSYTEFHVPHLGYKLHYCSSSKRPPALCVVVFV